MKREAGFTLIELMVTLVVLAVGFSVVLPPLTKLFRTNLIGAEANNFLTQLNYARTWAVKGGQSGSIEVCASNDAGDACENNSDWAIKGWLIRVSDDGTGNPAVLRTVAPSKNIKLEVANSFKFNSMGSVLPDNGVPANIVVNICDKNSKGKVGRTITIRATGRAQIENLMTCS